MSQHEHEEILTPAEIRKMYGLEYDEDIRKFVKRVNATSKGNKIVILSKEGDNNENDD